MRLVTEYMAIILAFWAVGSGLSALGSGLFPPPLVALPHERQDPARSRRSAREPHRAKAEELGVDGSSSLRRAVLVGTRQRRACARGGTDLDRSSVVCQHGSRLGARGARGGRSPAGIAGVCWTGAARPAFIHRRGSVLADAL